MWTERTPCINDNEKLFESRAMPAAGRKEGNEPTCFAFIALRITKRIGCVLCSLCVRRRERDEAFFVCSMANSTSWAHHEKFSHNCLLYGSMAIVDDDDCVVGWLVREQAKLFHSFERKNSRFVMAMVKFPIRFNSKNEQEEKTFYHLNINRHFAWCLLHTATISDHMTRSPLDF